MGCALFTLGFVDIRVDQNHRAFFSLWVANRWLAIRIDALGAFVVCSAATAIFAMRSLGLSVEAGAAGLCLTYALQFTDSLLVSE